MTEFLTSAAGRRLAYSQLDGSGPGLVFLGGFKSDMQGSKALFLEAWARDQGRAFLRFDYSGHGQSSGAFEDGCIGDWAEDAAAVITARTSGPLILIGSEKFLGWPVAYWLGWTLGVAGAVFYWAAGLLYVRETVRLAKAAR